MSHSTRNAAVVPASASAADRPWATAGESPTAAIRTSPASAAKRAALAGAEDRIADEDVADAGRGHHLGLAELLAGDADRAAGELLVRERGELVRLDVRPERDAERVAVGLHAVDVALDRVEVDDQRGRVDVGEPHLPMPAVMPRTKNRCPAR